MLEDMTLDRPYRRGDRGGKVTLIQEWLCLQGRSVVIDGDFGAATERAVKRFQEGKGLITDGVVGPLTFAQLIAPMTAALRKINPFHQSLGEVVGDYAEQHLAQHPREVGGQNRGPWVRLYMKGSQGPESPWCAGFACFILEQAASTLGVTPPVASSFSSSQLAHEAQARHILIPGTNPQTQLPSVGSLFLVRGGATGWQHTGLVIEPDQDVFETIEGNTNDEGSPDGYEVCRRTRSYDGKDFILI